MAPKLALSQLADEPLPPIFTIEKAPHIPDSEFPRPLERVLPQLKEILRMNAYPKSSKFKYHNWNGHIEKAEKFALKLCARCEELGIPVNVPVVLAILYTHDAFCHKNPKKYGAEHKEQVSGHLAYHLLKKLFGCSEDDARAVEAGVFSTHANSTLETIEQKIARAADLHNVGDKKRVFLSCLMNLFDESIVDRKILGLPPKPFQPWLVDSLNFLGKFLFSVIDITPDSRDLQGRSLFHIKALRNIINAFRLKYENKETGDKTRVIALIGEDPESTTIPERISPGDVILCCTSPNNLPARFEAISENLGSKDSMLLLPVPGDSAAIPIPSNYCDIVILDIQGPNDFKEASRILKPGGELRVIINPVTTPLNDVADNRFYDLARNAGFEILSGTFDFATPTHLVLA